MHPPSSGDMSQEFVRKHHPSFSKGNFLKLYMVAYYLAFDLFHIDWGGDKHVFPSKTTFNYYWINYEDVSNSTHKYNTIIWNSKKSKRKSDVFKNNKKINYSKWN
jgi:hypothetical protein